MNVVKSLNPLPSRRGIHPPKKKTGPKGEYRFPKLLLRPPKALLDQVREVAQASRMGISDWVMEAIQAKLTPLNPVPSPPKTPVGRRPDPLLTLAATVIQRRDWAEEWPILREMEPGPAFRRFSDLRRARQPAPPTDLLTRADAVVWLNEHYPLT